MNDGLPWSGTLKKSRSKYSKIFKVRLTILGNYALKVVNPVSANPTKW